MALHIRKKPYKHSVLRLAAAALLLAGVGASQTAPSSTPQMPSGKFSKEVAYDLSPSLAELMQRAPLPTEPTMPEEIGPEVVDQGHSGDGALQGSAGPTLPTPLIPAPLVSFEGISNQDNFNLYGFRVNPPDPDGDVGPNHYVEMINLALAVYDKAGNLLLGPVPIGALWDGFAVEDCTDPSGDPIVLYDQLADRWLLSQFTTRGPIYYNCVAISQTGDPTGAYYRYAFSSGEFFPDYPKYGVWSHSYILTSRDFGPTIEYGISVYALERNKMINGEPKVGVVQFFLDSAVVPIYLMGDGLLPPDIDCTRKPLDHDPAPIIGTIDDDHPYGAPFDALNVFELTVKWSVNPKASFNLVAQIPVAEFDSVFTCAPTSRDCLPQPGIVNPAQYLDILSYRQRPTWRLAYRNFGKYEALVTTQSVEAAPGVAGMRWYEIQRTGFPKPSDEYSVYQQGTFDPGDGVNRWMGSIAQDKFGNAALGYSVVNGTNVFPGIRYTGRLAGDPLGQMTLGEGTIVNGTGVQRTTNSRWGDYTSMNVDPVDDCTFWYVNEYYTLAGQQSSTAGWQTRIASFKLPGCS